MSSPTTSVETSDGGVSEAKAKDEVLQEASQKDDDDDDIEANVSSGDVQLSDIPIENGSDDEVAGTTLAATATAATNATAVTAPPLPEYLVCPISKQMLQDPVVLSDGISYERQVVVDQRPDEPIVYPNRSLKSILAEFQTNKTTSLMPKQQSLFQQAKMFLTAQEDRPLPDSLYCPITLGLMHHPVVDPQGYTYEKAAIVNWIRDNGDSPVTRTPLTVDSLVPNHALEQLLRAEANQAGGGEGGADMDIHPAILKWKMEPPPVEHPIELSVPAGSASAGANTNQLDTVGGPDGSTLVLPFPVTRLEWEAQLERSRQRKRNRMLCRSVIILLLLLVLVACFFVPILAAVMVVILIAAVWIGMSDTTRSRRF